MTAPAQGSVALRKSARIYRRMLGNPALRGKAPEHPEWRAVAAYLRELYREYGRAAVRFELQQSESAKP